MLETSPTQQYFEDQGAENFDPLRVIAIVKRRILYFVIPFLIIALAGAAIIKLMPKAYQAEGEVLIESPEVAPDLVHPTITDVADERFAVLKRRVLASGNLLAVVEKFNLFPRERRSLSQSQLVDLMRSRIEIKPVAIELHSNTPAFAFSVAFEYELPDVALKITDEFLTEIMSDDTSRRTDRAAATTSVLEQEVKRLESQHDALMVRIEALKQRPPDRNQAMSEEITAQMKALAALQADLVQRSSVYSDEHPAVKDLKRKIAALKHTIAAGPAPGAGDSQSDKADVTTQALLEQEKDLEKNLEDANQKLTVARLGESLERNQQAGHLRVIAYPDLPDKPIRPNKLKLLVLAIAAAGAVGAGCVFAAETLDGSIRRSSDLAKVVDKNLIVTIPYLSTVADDRRGRRNFTLLCIVLLAATAAAIVGIMAIDPSAEFPAGVSRSIQLH
jgi:capsular polysaccharide biosynthesis protein